ncbi:TIGR03943 family putative permease subunit [Bacillus sp. NEB1478]|uniref:TIGR03943 family putative permease subunit n=1 Tax=Bacillus sp. NEB1478 TaxID=3073816 RepID=UPI0028730879|nr:TIGR03943 family protein [Bacillus sp. NEB1478]WNB91287.1 TIGR03943 family protein [Bacillus sp. NEB1478]
MIRILILTGFTFLFMHLHATGNISKYINMKYSYISFSAIFILGLLTLVQFYIYAKGDDDGHHHHDGESCALPDCGHDHKKPSRLKSIFISIVLIFPIISGLFFPIASLDAQTVKTKGFHFKGVENKDDYGEHQFLKPDRSVFYGAEGYQSIMKKESKSFTDQKNIVLNDENYLKGMESIYYEPGLFLGKNIKFKGFTYNDEESKTKSNQLFLLRFGIIHCIADSGVFGMMVEFPKGTKFPDDKWIQINGEIETMYYQPFKSEIPYVKVKSWKTIEKPKEEYVYRKN